MEMKIPILLRNFETIHIPLTMKYFIIQIILMEIDFTEIIKYSHKKNLSTVLQNTKKMIECFKRTANFSK